MNAEAADRRRRIWEGLKKAAFFVFAAVIATLTALGLVFSILGLPG